MDDQVLKDVIEASAGLKDAPLGYYPIEMSSKGLYGAPKSFYVRDFSTEEALELGMVSQEDLPVKIVSMAQKLIYNDEAHISDFLDSEVSEFLIKFYITFYQHKLCDLDYTPTEKDKDFAAKELFSGKDSPEYQGWLRAIANKKIPLKFDIDLNSVKYYEVDETKKQPTRVKYTKNGFECTFAYPRFGDVVVIQKAIKDKFREQDRKYGPLYDKFKRKQDMENRYKRGEAIDPSTIEYIPEEDLQAVRKYEIEKTAYIVSLMKGMYLDSIEGRSVRDLPLEERIEIAASDPRIDYPAYQMVSDAFKDIKVGPMPKVKIHNPITGGIVDYDYTFRPLVLLAAIRNYKPDGATIEYI